MAATERPRPAIIWMVVAALIGAYAIWVTLHTDRMRDLMDESQARERQLVGQLQQLASMSRAPGSHERRAPEALVVALMRRPDLIPLEPVLGGRFYFLEDSVQTLSDRYVYAMVEDGHVRGHILMEHDGRDGFRVIDAYLE